MPRNNMVALKSIKTVSIKDMVEDLKSIAKGERPTAIKQIGFHASILPVPGHNIEAFLLAKEMKQRQETRKLLLARGKTNIASEPVTSKGENHTAKVITAKKKKKPAPRKEVHSMTREALKVSKPLISEERVERAGGMIIITKLNRTLRFEEFDSHRFTDCEHFRKVCLAHADTFDWKSFSCINCPIQKKRLGI